MAGVGPSLYSPNIEFPPREFIVEVGFLGGRLSPRKVITENGLPSRRVSTGGISSEIMWQEQAELIFRPRSSCRKRLCEEFSPGKSFCEKELLPKLVSTKVSFLQGDMARPRELGPRQLRTWCHGVSIRVFPQRYYP